MKTLNENFKRNLDIMGENLRRGLDMERANAVIDNMERQFLNANLYDKEAQEFIQDMKALVLSHFTKVNINIIR